ncbi:MULTISPECIES: YciI family protein [Flavobacterium]|uniref:YciI family protein n=1 Tax=Flavobacterium TaxID=237 RepID=UPI001C90C7E4|nr:MULTISPECIES: YciI family protein [Flavobacterium]MCR4033508.1 YciI family protein [Flavobacterium panacis]
MTTLKEFMLLFRFVSSNEKFTQEQEQEMHKQWGNFIGNIAMQGKLVSTHQLGFEGNQILSDLSTVNGFKISSNEIVGGNMILKAKDMEEAILLAQKCPVLQMGGNVEVRDILPIS